MKKRMLSLLLALVMVFSIVPTVALAEDAAQEIQLDSNLAIAETKVINRAVIVHGNGYVISYADGFDGTMFEIQAGGSLTLENVIIDGGNAWDWGTTVGLDPDEYWYANIINAKEKTLSASIFDVNQGALTLGNGTTVQNCVFVKQGEYSGGYNGGLGVIGAENGTITFNGASITRIAGTILSAKNAVTLMQGETSIYENYGCGNKGGMFDVDGGTLTMAVNTSIRDNRTWARSGEVFGIRNDAVFTMNGGKITNNSVAWGGINTNGPMIGVETGGKFVMNDGAITGNTGYLAGAIASRWVTNNNSTDHGIFLNGGTISDNTTTISSWSNAQVFVRSELTIKEGMTVGGPVVSDSNGHVINNGTIDGDLIVNYDTGKAVSSGDVTGKLIVNAGKLTITGGRYNEDPELYLGDGYTQVFFDANGGTLELPHHVVRKGSTTDKPIPQMPGYHLVGWFYENGNEFNFSTPVNSELKLVAKWAEGEETETDDIAEFPVYLLPVISDANPFRDVPGGAYYNEAVRWAVKYGIASGTDAKHFSPDAACTRGQAVTFLWRAAGCPAPALAENPFADVKPTDYCYDAVLWAVQTGVAKGTSASTFSPDAPCTRGQIVTFLYRAAGSPSGYGNSGYTDVPETSYCAAPVAWAVALRVTSGTSAITFSPDALCTRAQIVTFLYRANA